ncbi:Methylated-DNA--protein-cysteine methyltransferase [hydrothermal vent metagenome]|uniref:methylated-DNA--[protein]-cysteine S-methyltransferase n=1 Tax=hydrothermal vent metagenome TaxID=652676 RepID=A0A3B1CMG0_9ZZZZ
MAVLRQKRMSEKSVMPVDTAFGPMAIGYVGEKIGRVWLPGHQAPKLKQISHEWAGNNVIMSDKSLAIKLINYFNGEPVSIGNNVAYGDLKAFGLKVLHELSMVRWGERVTYGELAERAGRPNSARAVGAVMSKNLVPLVIPCHRVIRSDGTLGGFTSPGGVAMKKRMLALEKG